MLDGSVLLSVDDIIKIVTAMNVFSFSLCFMQLQ